MIDIAIAILIASLIASLVGGITSLLLSDSELRQRIDSLEKARRRVWFVTVGDSDGTSNHGAFSSEKTAKEYIDLLPDVWRRDAYIEEFVLDEFAVPRRID